MTSYNILGGCHQKNYSSVVMHTWYCPYLRELVHKKLSLLPSSIFHLDGVSWLPPHAQMVRAQILLQTSTWETPTLSMGLLVHSEQKKLEDVWFFHW